MDLNCNLSDDLRRETEALRRIARGILLEPALAEDAVQEAWLAALKVHPHGNVSGGWLNQTVQNIARGLRRREARQNARDRAAARSELVPSAADTAARVELLRELLSLLSELEEPYRTAAQLRLVDDLPTSEIAERTRVPLETARTRVKRAVEKLRAKLDARHAHRRTEFLAVLAPLAGIDPSGLATAAVTSAGTMGVSLMSMQVKFAATAALLLAVGLVWWSPWSQPSLPDSPSHAAAQPNVESKNPSGFATKSEIAGIDASASNRTVPDGAAQHANTANSGDWIVRGKVVVDREKPLEGIEVRVVVTEGYEGVRDALYTETVRSRDGGEFSIALEQPATAVRVHASVEHPDYLAFADEELVLHGSEAPTRLVVRCYERDVTLRGRVVDSNSLAIAGAKVNATGQTVESDAEGRFAVRSTSHFDETHLTAWAPGYAETRMTVEVDDRTPAIEGLEIVLREEGVLRGRVIDEVGRSVPNAKLITFASDHSVASSGPDGRFELRGLPLDRDWLGIGIKASGFARRTFDLQGGRVPPDPVEIVLTRGVRITGQVVDEERRGLPGSTLCFGASQFDVDAVRCIAGDDGQFTLVDARPVQEWLRVTSPGFAPTTMQIDARDPASLAPLTIVMTLGRTILGVVVDENGQPLKSISITARADGDYIDVSASSNATGQFELRGIPQRDGLELECYATGFVRQTVPLALADTSVRVTMSRAAGLSGRVIDASTGEPIKRFRVRFVPADLAPGEEPISGYSSSWSEGGREFHDEQGRWNTGGEELAVGMVTGIEITAADYGAAIAARVITSFEAEQTPIVIALSAPVGVAGVVVDARTGLGVAGALVRRVSARESDGARVANPDSPVDRTTTDAFGAFEFKQLPAEPTWLIVEALGFAPVLDGPFEPDASRVRRRIELAPGATLRGVLKDSAGQPLAQQTVRVGTFDARTKEHRSWGLETDDDGRFELADLAPGEYQASRELRLGSRGVYDLSQFVQVRDASVYEVELRPQGHRRINGTVRGSGAPLRGMVTAFRVESDPAVERETRVTFVDDARFVLDGVSAGRWELHFEEFAKSGSSRNATAVVVVAPERDEDVILDLVER